MRMSKRLEKVTHISTIVAAIVTALSLGMGYWQFSRTLEVQREAFAVALFMDYLKLVRELETAEAKESRYQKINSNTSVAHPSDAVLSAIATTAEAIFVLR